MAYSVVIGDLGPSMPIQLMDSGAPFALDSVNDTITLNYRDPTGLLHSVLLTITSAPNGQTKRVWVNGDLPAFGSYVGLVTVARVGDGTFPRTFPNDGTKVIWFVYPQV